MPKSKLNLPSFGSILFVLTCFIFFTGCASIDYKNKHDFNASNLARQISNSNKEIKTSKGIGWLKIKENKRQTIYKIAWVAEPPYRIRITLIANSFPVETIVSNKESITLFSHTGKHSLKTFNIKNPSLEDIISIPVKIEDIIALLSGQVPIKDFNYAFFDDQTNDEIYNNDNSLKLITLKNKSDHGIQKIYVNSKNQIKRYIITDRKIKPLYEVLFVDSIEIDSSIIPSKLIIQDNSDREVYLEISKFYKNLPVKKTTFSLTE